MAVETRQWPLRSSVSRRRAFQPAREHQAPLGGSKHYLSADSLDHRTRKWVKGDKARCPLAVCLRAVQSLPSPSLASPDHHHLYHDWRTKALFGYLRDMAKYPAGRCFVLGGHVAFRGVLWEGLSALV